MVVQLAPAFAPVHVANIQKLARAGYWQGAAIYRVQDNYVAQWGNNESEKPLPAGVVKTPPAEYHRALKGLKIVPLGSPDAYAPAAGFSGGWPVAYDPKAGTANLTHCYASVGVGRGLSPDTGMGGELYAAIGHAPRHLDRGIAVVGRVVSGIENLSSLPRGTEALGLLQGAQLGRADRQRPSRVRAGAGGAAAVRISEGDQRVLRRLAAPHARTARTISTFGRPAESICATRRCRSGRSPHKETPAPKGTGAFSPSRGREFRPPRPESACGCDAE